MQENYIVGIYARLSWDDERAGESASIENQKEMLSRYVREQGWTLYDYYCDDTAIMGLNRNQRQSDGGLVHFFLFSEDFSNQMLSLIHI